MTVEGTMTMKIGRVDTVRNGLIVLPPAVHSPYSPGPFLFLVLIRLQR